MKFSVPRLLGRPADLSRARTARQLATRKWVTLAVLSLCPTGLLAAAFFSNGHSNPVLATLFSFLLFAPSSALLVRVAPVPKVWEAAGDEQMLQLMYLAHLHPRAAALVLQVNALSRDFTVQDWLQARDIEREDSDVLFAEDAKTASIFMHSMCEGA